METWKRWNLPKNEGTRVHRIGDRRICVAVDMVGDQYVLAAMALPPEASRGSRLALPSLSDKAWTRFFMDKAEDYELAPAYPPMPTCIRLKQPFSLAPGSTVEGWIFSRIEASILVNGARIASFPLATPYKTLYGSPEAGVICRYDEEEFLAAAEPLASSLHADQRFVAHPVRLRNASAEPVEVSDLCIYGEQLSIVGDEKTMQSERLLFVFSSSGVRMSLDGTTLLPLGSRVMAKPAVSGEERFIVRSFELFKNMTRI
ncbi:MAG TPA: DUF432 domain-containing protein [Spirochaetales bacterium]|nr:DUF432 domain-containing protein [Spirochaetales bacterium]HPM73492.1 DUF432 domain-containing protein [Spirochaetales bacterium]